MPAFEKTRAAARKTAALAKRLNPKRLISKFKLKSSFGKAALHLAKLCTDIRWDMLETNIGNCDVNAKFNGGMTYLMLATIAGRTRLVRLLLKHGAYIEDRDDEGRTALMHAAMHNNTYSFVDLLEKGADFTASDYKLETVLDYAKANGNRLAAHHIGVAIAKKLIDRFGNWQSFSWGFADCTGIWGSIENASANPWLLKR